MSTEGSKFGKVPHGSISGNLTTNLAIILTGSRADFKPEEPHNKKQKYYCNRMDYTNSNIRISNLMKMQQRSNNLTK